MAAKPALHSADRLYFSFFFDFATVPERDGSENRQQRGVRLAFSFVDLLLFFVPGIWLTALLMNSGGHVDVWSSRPPTDH
jgi:hypothetical protein